jgi:hypothetical protein
MNSEYTPPGIAQGDLPRRMFPIFASAPCGTVLAHPAVSISACEQRMVTFQAQ